MSFKIYKGEETVAEGESPLSITGLQPATTVKKGEYHVVRVNGEYESDRVAIEEFRTLDVKVTGVSVEPKAVELGVGGTKQLVATLAPTNATDKTITYESKTKSVADVDTNGIVTAKEVGKSDIVVTSRDGSKKATCVVTVTEPEE